MASSPTLGLYFAILIASAGTFLFGGIFVLLGWLTILLQEKDVQRSEGMFAHAVIPDPPRDRSRGSLLPLQTLTAAVLLDGMLLLWYWFGDRGDLNVAYFSLPVALGFALVVISFIYGVRGSKTLVIMGAGAAILVHLLALAILIFGR